MFDTVIAVVGNVLTMPEWRRLERTGALVANFRLASTSRRYDRAGNRWLDGDSLRLRVTCWRRLAEGVAASVKVGDPVIVTGRLYTREWTADDGQRRTSYELEAVAVGHDLARGIGVFKRGRHSVSTSEVVDADADVRVAGEPSEAMPELNERSAALVSAEFDDDDDFRERVMDLDESGPGFDAPAATDVEDPFADLGSVLSAVGADIAGVEALIDEPPAAGPAEAIGPAEAAGRAEAAGAMAEPVGSGSPEPGGGEGSRGRRGRGRVPANV
jgi:single-strand DNA-binding protein